MTEMHNYMETLVLEFIPRYTHSIPDFCECERCKYDIAAIALNDLKPKYIVSNHGELYSDISDLRRQNEADITMAVLKAIEKVKLNPRHQGRLVNPKTD